MKQGEVVAVGYNGNIFEVTGDLSTVPLEPCRHNCGRTVDVSGALKNGKFYTQVRLGPGLHIPNGNLASSVMQEHFMVCNACQTRYKY